MSAPSGTPRSPSRTVALQRLFLEPEVHAARKRLPGYVRHRLVRAIDSLADNPRPPQSQLLDTEDLDVPPAIELRRLRIDRWRVVYALNEQEGWVWVLAIRQRPPYDYEDLGDLVAG